MDRLVIKMDCTCSLMVMLIHLQSQNLELDVGCHMSKLQDRRVSTVAAGFVCKYHIYNRTVPAAEQHVFREMLRSVINSSTLMTLKMCPN